MTPTFDSCPPTLRFNIPCVAQTPEDTMDAAVAIKTPKPSTETQQTTITVWVYPESFGEFRKLKERLFQEGFLCAARPLPENMRIGASPRGSSSAAQ